MVYSNMTVCPTIGPEDPQCANFDFANYFLVWVILGLFGTVGNSLSIATLFRDSVRNVSSFLLSLLAVSDTIQIWTMILLHSARILCFYSGKKPAACHYRFYIWPYMWKYARPIWFFGILMSNWITVLVTFHRAIAVMKPHRTRVLGSIRRVRLQCLFIVILAISMSIPTMFETKIDAYPGCEPDIVVNNYEPVKHNAVYMYFYKHVLLNMVGKVIPVMLLIVLTCLLVATIHKGATQRRSLGRRGPDTLKEERQLTILLTVVALVFLICQIPHVSIMYIPLDSIQCPTAGYYIQSLTDTLTVVNTSVNFVLYCLIGTRFRKMLRELWCCSPKQASVDRANLGIEQDCKTDNGKDSMAGLIHHKDEGTRLSLLASSPKTKPKF